MPIVAFVAVLAVIIVFRRLQTGAFQSIQLASVLTQVARRGREVIDGLYVLKAPASDPTDGPHRASAAAAATDLQEIHWPRPAAVVQVIDVPRVLRAAERARAVIAFKVGSGDMIAEGATIALVRGQTAPELEREVLKAFTVGQERTFEQDPAFALRLLADIGLRALSPAVNDPTTAVQALDATDGLLRVLATRDLSVEHVAGATAPSESNLCSRPGTTTSPLRSMSSSYSRPCRRTSRAGSYGCSTSSRRSRHRAGDPHSKLAAARFTTQLAET